jgi:hypothetical protein
MTTGNLEILDMDRKFIPHFRKIHKNGLAVCKQVGAILDLATSDVCLHLYAKNLKMAQKVANVYGTTAVFGGRGLNGQHKDLNWYCIEM